MTNLEDLIKREREKISKLPKDAQAKAITNLNDWLKSYSTAKQLCYEKSVLDKILNARNCIHAENILIDARRKCS